MGIPTNIRTDDEENLYFVDLAYSKAFKEYAWTLAGDEPDELKRFKRAYRLLETEFKEANPYIDAFDYPARNLGEWAENEVSNSCPGLLPPEDPHHDRMRLLAAAIKEIKTNMKGRVEIKIGKATEGVKQVGKIPIKFRAMASSTTMKHGFRYNRIDECHCDILLVIGLYTDKMRYWVMTPEEAIESFHMGINHNETSRSEHKTFFIGSGQFERFRPFECEAKDIVACIDARLSGMLHLLPPALPPAPIVGDCHWGA